MAKDPQVKAGETIRGMAMRAMLATMETRAGTEEERDLVGKEAGQVDTEADNKKKSGHHQGEATKNPKIPQATRSTR